MLNSTERYPCKKCAIPKNTKSFFLRDSLSAPEYKEIKLIDKVQKIRSPFVIRWEILFAEKGKTLSLFCPGIFHDLTLMKCFDISPSGEEAKGGKFGEHNLHP